LTDLKDIALGIAKVAPIASRLRPAVEFRELLDPSIDQPPMSDVDVLDRESDLVPHSIVLRILASLEQLKEIRPAHIEMHPVLIAAELPEPDDVPIEASLGAEILHHDADPVRPAKATFHAIRLLPEARSFNLEKATN
jgi:hypothetical protein